MSFPALFGFSAALPPASGALAGFADTTVGFGAFSDLGAALDGLDAGCADFAAGFDRWLTDCVTAALVAGFVAAFSAVFKVFLAAFFTFAGLAAFTAVAFAGVLADPE